MEPRAPYKYCFISEGKNEGKEDWTDENNKVKTILIEFLKSVKMEPFNVFEGGKRVWDKVVEGIVNCPFGFYVVGSYNRNVHIEIGYAFAHSKPVILVVKAEKSKINETEIDSVDIASDIKDIFQIRYEDINDLEKKLKDQNNVPARYYSPIERFEILIKSSSFAQKYILAYLSSFGPQRLTDIVVDVRRCVPCDNTDISEFIRVFKEFLDINIKKEGAGDKQIIGINNDYKKTIEAREELRAYIKQYIVFKE